MFPFLLKVIVNKNYKVYLSFTKAYIHYNNNINNIYYSSFGVGFIEMKGSFKQIISSNLGDNKRVYNIGNKIYFCI